MFDGIKFYALDEGDLAKIRFEICVGCEIAQGTKAIKLVGNLCSRGQMMSMLLIPKNLREVSEAISRSLMPTVEEIYPGLVANSGI